MFFLRISSVDHFAFNCLLSFFIYGLVITAHIGHIDFWPGIKREGLIIGIEGFVLQNLLHEFANFFTQCEQAIVNLTREQPGNKLEDTEKDNNELSH